jgi:hypothetical protein
LSAGRQGNWLNNSVLSGMIARSLNRKAIKDLGRNQKFYCMPVNFIQEKKKQKTLIIVFAVTVLISVLVLWFGYFKEKKTVPAQKTAKTYYREININFSVLKGEFLKGLQSFEKIAPFTGQKGRSNPFLPD